MKHRLASGVAILPFLAGVAGAQPLPRYAEEPTAGLNLPTTGLSGEHDALSVSSNPAGLHFLGGWQLALAFDWSGTDEEEATGPGQGWGMFAAGTLGGR